MPMAKQWVNMCPASLIKATLLLIKPPINSIIMAIKVIVSEMVFLLFHRAVFA